MLSHRPRYLKMRYECYEHFRIYISKYKSNGLIFEINLN